MSHHQLFAILGKTTVQEMMREREREEWAHEAIHGICVAAEDREPSPVVSLADDIPDYFAGIKQPNPINQEDGE